VFIRNAPTFLDEARDPKGQRLDLDQLRRPDRPVLLTKGSASPPFLIGIVDTIASLLPRLEIETIEGADHAPHQTTPKQYIDLVRRFVQAARVTYPSGCSTTPDSSPAVRRTRISGVLRRDDAPEPRSRVSFGLRGSRVRVCGYLEAVLNSSLDFKLT
jgi:hypothetical protein